jgi:hypothetical protein
MQSLRLSFLCFVSFATAVTFSNQASADGAFGPLQNTAEPVSVECSHELVAAIFGCGSWDAEPIPLDHVLQPLPPARRPFDFRTVSQSQFAIQLSPNSRFLGLIGAGFDFVPAEELVLANEALPAGSRRQSLSSMPTMGNSSRRDDSAGAKTVSFRKNLSQASTSLGKRVFELDENLFRGDAFEESLVGAKKTYVKLLQAEQQSQRKRTQWLANALTIGLSTALLFSFVFVGILFRSLAKK